MELFLLKCRIMWEVKWCDGHRLLVWYKLVTWSVVGQHGLWKNELPWWTYMTPLATSLSSTHRIDHIWLTYLPFTKGWEPPMTVASLVYCICRYDILMRSKSPHSESHFSWEVNHLAAKVAFIKETGRLHRGPYDSLVVLERQPFPGIFHLQS